VDRSDLICMAEDIATLEAVVSPELIRQHGSLH
jgi:hypothetical protein